MIMSPTLQTRTPLLKRNCLMPTFTSECTFSFIWPKIKHHPNVALAILAAMEDTAKIWVMDSTVLAQEITLVSAANMSMTPAQLMPARMVPPVLTREWDTNVSVHLAMKARTVT